MVLAGFGAILSFPNQMAVFVCSVELERGAIIKFTLCVIAVIMSTRTAKILKLALNSSSFTRSERFRNKPNYRYSSDTSENVSKESNFSDELEQEMDISESSFTMSDESMFNNIGEIIENLEQNVGSLEHFIDEKDNSLEIKKCDMISNEQLEEIKIDESTNLVELDSKPYGTEQNGTKQLEQNNLNIVETVVPTRTKLQNSETDGRKKNISKKLEGINPNNRHIDVPDCTIQQYSKSNGLEQTTIERPQQNNLKNTQTNAPDLTIINFGKSVNVEQKSIEGHTTKRYWTKKTSCPYCMKEITHFGRHLKRIHSDEGAVQHLNSLSLGDPKRKELLDTMRKQGNFVVGNACNTIRPVKRPLLHADEQIVIDAKDVDDFYVLCVSCLGYYKRDYLRRHRNKCKLISKKKNCVQEKVNHLSIAQIMTICTGSYKEFYDNLRLKKEVFPIMRSDERSRIAMGDILICSYAESLLKKHKRIQIRNSISNKMRELARLLIFLKETIGITHLIEAMKPEFFDNIIAGTKYICGYDEESKSFKASSLAIHMGTTLRQVCDIANKLIIKKCRFLPSKDPENDLKNIKRLKALLTNHWNTEISSLALKHLNQQSWDKPTLMPLTSDIMCFQNFVMQEAEIASEALEQECSTIEHYRTLTECVVASTLLLNRKRIGEIQYLKLRVYCSQDNNTTETQQRELIGSLTRTEQILLNTFKRVVTGGKRSRPVAILFPKKIQKYISVLIKWRHLYVKNTNEYLFANPSSANKWISCYHVVQKLAKKAHVTDVSLFTSTRLRKQIATVLQALNLTDTDMEQFATFLGHTKKTHENFYRLPQDVFQTAKVSKLLLAINSGRGLEFKDKSLDDIEFSDSVDTSDDEDLSNLKNDPFEFNPDEPGTSKKPILRKIKKKTKRNTRTSEKEHKAYSKTRWTEEEKACVKEFFLDHIKNKIVPKKKDFKTFMINHKDLYETKGWVKIKTFVYNCFKKIAVS